MKEYIKAAFETVCADAKHAEPTYVSLYRSCPFYGGPEEGGWWGEDVELVASQHFPTRELANLVLDKVQALAEKLGKIAEREYGDQCLRETAWLDARGLDDDFFPEPDGPEKFFVCCESVAGASSSIGDRHYE